jgi:hypothetical protein
MVLPVLPQFSGVYCDGCMVILSFRWYFFIQMVTPKESAGFSHGKCQVKLSGPHQGFMEHMERYRCPGTGWEHQARKMGDHGGKKLTCNIL